VNLCRSTFWKRGVSGSIWDIGQVPIRNFDWLPFTPLWSPSPVLQIEILIRGRAASEEERAVRGKGTRKGGGGGSEVTSASWRWTWSGTAPSQTLRAASSDHAGSSYGATIALPPAADLPMALLVPIEPRERRNTFSLSQYRQSMISKKKKVSAVKETSSLLNHFYLCSID
jgi:hypothetical protein